MKKTSLFFALAIVLGFSSCSLVGDLQIEKRHYGKGYYVHMRDGQVDEVKNENKIQSSLVNEEVAVINPTEEKNSVEEINTEARGADEVISDLAPGTNSRTEAGSEKSQIKKTISEEKEESPKNISRKKTPPERGADTNEVLMIILAIFLSPIAVYLKEGASGRFWIDLICWLLGGGIVAGGIFYGGGLLLFAIVFAILIVVGII